MTIVNRKRDGYETGGEIKSWLLNTLSEVETHVT